MRAIVLTGHGGLDKLEYRTDWPKPEAGPGEALIRVLACGMNNTDVNTRSGWYSKAVSEGTTGDGFAVEAEEDPSWGGAAITFPRIQGADAVGIVEAVGEGADPALIGRRVMVDVWLRDWDDPLNRNKAGYFGSECDGGFAEYTKVDARNVVPVDSGLGDAELATFACSYSTAEGMLNRANVGDSDTVLIPGASGGVGGALVQLARRRGARVLAMTSEEKAAAVTELGADRIIPRSPDNLRKAVGEPVTVVADIVGGPLWPQLLDILERGGRYTCSGAIAGPMVEMDLRTFYLRDLTLTGSTVIPPGVFQDLVGYIERGEVRPALAATYPLADFHAGQEAFIAKRHVGNIVVVP